MPLFGVTKLGLVDNPNLSKFIKNLDRVALL